MTHINIMQTKGIHRISVLGSLLQVRVLIQHIPITDDLTPKSKKEIKLAWPLIR